MIPTRLKVAVLFGGRSGEHEVSLVSAASIMNALDPAKFEVIPVGITRDGKWIVHPRALDLLKQNDLKSISNLPGYTTGETGSGLLVRLPTERPLPAGVTAEEVPLRVLVDIVFPALHGTFGEDGTVQGLLEMAGIPYVGSGVLGSALGMDKIAQKCMCHDAGLPIVPFVWGLRSHWERNPHALADAAENKLRYPMFVKPANLGSSVGISRAHDLATLEQGIAEAMTYDRRVLVEQAVSNAREIEISVLGNDDPEVSVCGEVVPCNEFYDYNAKYIDGDSQLIVPAELTSEQRALIEHTAKAAFRILDLAGLSRVDFLVERDGMQRVYLNEPNTMPGFTSISMYPRLWDASGLPYPALLERLISLGLARYEDRRRNRTSFPTTDWYQKA